MKVKARRFRPAGDGWGRILRRESGPPGIDGADREGSALNDRVYSMGYRQMKSMGSEKTSPVGEVMAGSTMARPINTRSSGRRRAFRVSLALAAIITVCLPLFKWGPLIARARIDEPPSPPRVLGVDVEEVRLSAGYRVAWSFVGRVEAARSSDLGYEFSGLVSRLLVEEGDRVKSGQVLAELDTRRLRARRAELAAALKEAHASLSLAGSTRERTRRAFAERAVSAQQWDEARQRHEARKAAVGRIEARIAIVAVDIEKSRLAAPFEGIVARRYVDEGRVVSAGEPVYRLLEMDRLEVRGGIGSDHARRLAVGRELAVRIGRRRLAGTVRAILPDRTRETRTVDILLGLPPAARGIREGDLAELEMGDEISEPGIWLPRGSLTEGSRGLWACYVAEPMEGGVGAEGRGPGDATHRLARRPLELLHQQGDRAYVRGALDGGELVVSSGLHRIVPEQLVKISQTTGGEGR